MLGSGGGGPHNEFDRRQTAPVDGCLYSDLGSAMMKSVFDESENFTQQCSGAAPAPSWRAFEMRSAISAFCSSERPSNQWTSTKGKVGLYASDGSSSARSLRFGIAPTIFLTISPSLNRIMVGTERIS